MADNLERSLRLQALQNRVQFQQPDPDPIAYVVGFGEEPGWYVIQHGADQIVCESMQVSAPAIGQRVDVVGKKIDYL